MTQSEWTGWGIQVEWFGRKILFRQDSWAEWLDGDIFFWPLAVEDCWERFVRCKIVLGKRYLNSAWDATSEWIKIYTFKVGISYLRWCHTACDNVPDIKTIERNCCTHVSPMWLREKHFLLPFLAVYIKKMHFNTVSKNIFSSRFGTELCEKSIKPKFFSLQLMPFSTVWM